MTLEPETAASKPTPDPLLVPIAPPIATPQPWWSQKDTIQIVVIALVLAFLLRTLVIEPRYIPSGSMEPSLQVGDRIAVEKLTHRWQLPQRRQIIIFYPPFRDPDGDAKAYIKRVIGLPGDRINIHDGKLFLNGKAQIEPYIAEPMSYLLPNPELDMGEITVPEGYLWVMGDNRNNSNDSHVWGFLPQQNIIGRAIFRFFPFDQFGFLPRE
jgi:signal peptidase I